MADCCAVKTEPVPAPAALACPVSGTRSKQVELLTVKSLARHLPFALPATQYYFCDAPDCDVVYFPANPTAPRFRRADLLVPVGVKERADASPVCYCFGVTKRQIREEVRRTGKSTAPERIQAEVKAGRCACELKNPSGKCCLGNVTRAIQEAIKERTQHA
jgi:bacterioferritin-associated ferredoxin